MRPDIAILSPIGRGGETHGGITPFVLTLSGALRDAGTAVELISFAPNGLARAMPQLDPRLTVYELGPGNRRRHRRHLTAYVRQQRPGALLAAGHRCNQLAVAAVDAAGPVRPRVVLGVHNALSPGLAGLDPARRWMRLRAMRGAYPRASAVVCVSQGVADDLAALVPLAPERLRVIHNPIPTVAEGQSTAASAPVHAWLAPGEPPVILGAGRLTRQKAFDTLIRAFALLDEGADLRLLILGEGDERPRLERLAADLGLASRVALPGFVANPRAHMARAALFVLSSAWEGFGNVLVEAMSTGTSVVATDCPSGPREILRDGALGHLVPINDPAALAQAIRGTLAAPPADQAALKTRALDFAPDRVAQRYLDVLLPEPGR